MVYTNFSTIIDFLSETIKQYHTGTPITMHYYKNIKISAKRFKINVLSDYSIKSIQFVTLTRINHKYTLDKAYQCMIYSSVGIYDQNSCAKYTLGTFKNMIYKILEDNNAK